MIAGAELDHQVAELVMGWTLASCRMEGRHYERWDRRDGNGGAWHESVANLFRPSADIADAWAVLEYFSTYSLQRTMRGHLYQYRADVAHRGCDRWGDAIADTAPLAICLAALKAVGQGEKR